tara:strand:- start:5267 stop:5998 length:732 start_codon:yes stop_codon:yes gene_type:complete
MSIVNVVLTVLAFTVKPNALFFSGGNSLMPNLIYGGFIEKLNEVANVKPIQNSVSYFPNDNMVTQLLDNDITTSSTFAISHSSGATTLLNHCSRFNVDKVILLDPVDNNKLVNKQFPDINKFSDVLVIKAEKSYKWSFDKLRKNMLLIPSIKIPFIPLGKLDTGVFQNKTELIIKDFGHCDILDQPYNNYMHTSFSEGNENRELLPLYKTKLVEIVNLFINNDLNEDTLNSTLLDSGIEYSIE